MIRILRQISPLLKCNYARVARITAIVTKDYGSLYENEVVKVRAGFMRNHLFPKGVATYGTTDLVKKHEESITEEQRDVLKEKKRGEQVRRRFTKQRTLVVFANPKPLKEGQKWTRDIDPIDKERLASEISTQMNYPVTGKEIFLDDPIHQIGTWEVPIRVSKFVVTPLIFEIKTQQILDYLKSTAEVFADAIKPENIAKEEAEFAEMEQEEKDEREKEKQQRNEEKLKRREARKVSHEKRREKQLQKIEMRDDFAEEIKEQ